MKAKTLKIQDITILISVLSIAICALVIFSNIRLKDQYDNLKYSEENYINNVKSYNTLQKSSDFLTKQTWRFSVSGDINALNQYFKEVDAKNRQKAIDHLSSDENASEMLIKAKVLSDELMNLEYKIMKLVVEGYGIKKDLVRQEVLDFELNPLEQKLDAEAKKELARNIAFGEEYHRLKDQIDENIKIFSDMVINRAEQDMKESNYLVEQSIILQKIMLVVMIIIIIGICLALYFQLVVVLKSFTKKIQSDELLESAGVYELRYLADSYNNMLARKEDHEKLLKIQAETDPLTGLLNRRSFLELTDHTMRDMSDIATALVLLDVDKFKRINDTYGHDIGDEALKKLSKCLKNRFRHTDAVARLGGDEFAVLMVGLKIEYKKRPSEIINMINEELAVEENGLPAFSISAGVAFKTEDEDYNMLYHNADKALYTAKSKGGHSCTLYEKS